MSEQTTNRTFDDLARAVAEGSLSRRRALKLLAGTALAALIPSRALADDCVRVCHVPRTSTGDCDVANARTLCVSRRERRRHLDEHRCDCRGSCRNCLTAGACSGSQQACDNPFSCGANNECLCFNTTEGSHACVVDFPGCELPTCQSSNDCPAGTACVRTCCTNNLCAPLCGTTTSAALQAASGGGNPARKPTL